MQFNLHSSTWGQEKFSSIFPFTPAICFYSFPSILSSPFMILCSRGIKFHGCESSHPFEICLAVAWKCYNFHKDVISRNSKNALERLIERLCITLVFDKCLHLDELPIEHLFKLLSARFKYLTGRKRSLETLNHLQSREIPENNLHDGKFPYYIRV